MDTGLPCQIIEKFILFRRVFDDGLGSLSSVPVIRIGLAHTPLLLLVMSKLG